MSNAKKSKLSEAEWREFATVCGRDVDRGEYWLNTESEDTVFVPGEAVLADFKKNWRRRSQARLRGAKDELRYGREIVRAEGSVLAKIARFSRKLGKVT